MNFTLLSFLYQRIKSTFGILLPSFGSRLSSFRGRVVQVALGSVISVPLFLAISQQIWDTPSMSLDLYFLHFNLCLLLAKNPTSTIGSRVFCAFPMLQLLSIETEGIHEEE
ncbi:hypothetical protein ACJX0J_041727 [Zea mays]